MISVILQRSAAWAQVSERRHVASRAGTHAGCCSSASVSVRHVVLNTVAGRRRTYQHRLVSTVAARRRPGGGPGCASCVPLFMRCKGVGGSNGRRDGSSDSSSNVGSSGSGWNSGVGDVFYFSSIMRRFWRSRGLVRL